MRADRLVAALLLIQSRGRLTAAELADELEVSVATARRDLEAMSAAGIPVYPQPGRGGGWSLVGGARTDLSGLTASEAQALFLLVGPAAAVSGEAKSALRKLVRALPQTFREEAEAAAGATMIDPTRWGERDRRPTGAGGRPAACRRTTAGRCGSGTPAAGRAQRAGDRSLGSRRQGRRLVPPGRHRAGPAHVPGRPDRGRRGHRRAGRAARRLRARGGVGRGGRRDGGSPLAHLGDGAGRPSATCR